MGRRSSAAEAPVHVPIPRGVVAKTDKVKLFLSGNPFFSRDEIVARLGKDIETTLASMATDNRIKQVGDHVFCDPLIDAANPQVQKLMFLTGSRPIDPERIAKRADKGLVRREKQIETPGTALDVRLGNWIKTHRVFTRADAKRKLGVSPAQAIAKLQQRREIDTIFPGTYVYYGVLPARRYEAYRDYVAVKSAIQCAAVLAIDASQRATSRGPFIPAPAVINIDDEFKPWLGRRKIRQFQNGAKAPQRIWINFSNLETIYAVAGGENRTMPRWHAKKGSALTDDAAAIIAAHIFPSDMTFGQLCATARDYREKKITLPPFRPNGRFDHKAKFGEIQRGRYMSHRQNRAFAMPARCTLTIDNREDARIIEALHGIGNLEVDVAVLETGDYRFQWGSDETTQLMIVERKAGADFGSSIENGTMESQMLRLRAMACRRFLITEGEIYENDGSERGDENDRRKARWMASIGMVMPVVSTPNWQRTVDMLLTLAKRCMTESGVPDLSGVTTDPKTPACENPDTIAAGLPDGSSSA